jgi:hypothetical protein
MSSNFSKIPILDLDLANNPTTKPQFLEDLRHVLLDVGFLYVKNHGVPEHVIDALVEVLPALFAMPEDRKRDMALENSPHFLGYSGLGAEKTAQVADQREQFEFATEMSPQWAEGDPLYKRLLGPNQVHQAHLIICFQSLTYTAVALISPIHPISHRRIHPVAVRAFSPVLDAGCGSIGYFSIRLAFISLSSTPFEGGSLQSCSFRRQQSRCGSSQGFIRLVDISPASLTSSHPWVASYESFRRMD